MTGKFELIVQTIQAGTVSVVKEYAGMVAFVSGLTDAKIIKECSAQAAAILEYLSQRKDSSVEEYNAAVKIKAKVEHRLGEVLAATVKHKGRPQKVSHAATLSPATGTIPKEIDRSQSARTQQLARLPWEDIAKRIDAATGKNEKAALGRITKEMLQDQQRAANKALVEQTAPLTAVTGVFSTIVIDPPWDWGDEGDVSQLGPARPEYATLSFQALLDLPIADKATANSHLYLWITNRSMPKGFALLEAWGFRYITCLTWCKPSMGMGQYFRGSSEQVLFGVKGSLALLRKDVGTWFAAPRGGKHSAKPAEFFELVESCSPGPWLEMFARQQRPGWVTWGAEANGRRSQQSTVESAYPTESTFAKTYPQGHR